VERCDSFASLLRRHRLAAGLTQDALAERAHLSARTVSDLERGINLRPRLDSLLLLAEALHLAPPERIAFEVAARHLAPSVATSNDRHASSGNPAPPAPCTNLPRALTSFVDRPRERTALLELLATEPLVTLTGVGGCGKTRLALQVASDVLPRYPNGVWLVELAPVVALDLVPQVVAAALGVVEEAGHPLTATLAAFLQSRDLLLVLDNCEHVVAACAGLAETLLETCPSLQILATSREALGCAGWRPSCASSQHPLRENRTVIRSVPRRWMPSARRRSSGRRTWHRARPSHAEPRNWPRRAWRFSGGGMTRQVWP
jgi:transcriptional regulator with XRE-family HTH domain